MKSAKEKKERIKIIRLFLNELKAIYKVGYWQGYKDGIERTKDVISESRISAGKKI